METIIDDIDRMPKTWGVEANGPPGSAYLGYASSIPVHLEPVLRIGQAPEKYHR